MTIHQVHPFATPPERRRPLRRFRGRLPAPVTIWACTATSGRPVGLTVSSMVVADGEPGQVVGLIDPDSELIDAIPAAGRWAVSLLANEHRQLSDAMAGLAPAPGGPFRMSTWIDTTWGPALQDSPGWLGVRLEGEPVEAAWSMLVRGVIEHVEVDETRDPLAYFRGRYRVL